MSCPDEIRERILEQLKTPVMNQLAHEQIKVYLFGSWAP
ncbi:hypothetical protein FHS45_002377 [Thalassobacillus devorans]|nr:hypothetical protein [Thalassobacillus devorans]